MQVVRRTAFRAVNTAALPRSIQNRTPFVLRQNAQSLNAQLFRRFASNDRDSRDAPDSADGSETSAIRSAIDSVTQSVSETAAGVSTYAGQAAESVQENFESAKEAVVDNAQALGAAAGYSAHARERQPRDSGDRRPQRASYDGERRESGGERPFVPLDLEPTNSIYVGNLLFDTQEERLAELFSEIGTVVKARIATDDRGLSKGFGYVEFETVDEATRAIEAQNQQVLDGRRIVVNYQNTTKRQKTSLNDPSKTLFIGNLAFEMSDQDLNKLFKDIKNVVDVRVAIDRRTGQPRGFAHAEFTDVESAVQAREQLEGQSCFGRNLRVDYSGAKQQTPRSNGRGGRGGYGGGRGGDRGDRNAERY